MTMSATSSSLSPARMVLGFTLLFVAISCAPAAATRLAVPQTDEPGAVALRHFRAIISRDWRTSAELTHPVELARTKAAFLPVFAADTTAFLQLRVLELPREVQLPEMSDVDFNARLFAFHIGLAAQGSALSRFTDAEVLAVAMPYPDTAYVVYRWQLPPAGRPIRGAQVVKLQRDQNR